MVGCVTRGLVTRLFLVAVAVGAVCLSNPESGAQSSPKDFYQKNYAEKPLVTGEKAPESGGRRPAQGAAIERRAAPTESAANGAVQQSPRAGSQEPRNAMSGQLVVYVNSLDKEHFDRVVEHALGLLGKAEFYISSIVHIGDYRNISDRVKENAKRANIALYAASAPPEWLGITRSPAWVLYKTDGVHIVEGVVHFDRFINPMGEFSPQQQVKAALPTPTPMKMEGF